MVQARCVQNARIRSVRLVYGFTMVELMVTVAVLAIILGLAIPNFSRQIREGRAEMAAQGLLKAVASARAIASQTGTRTTLFVNGSAKCESGGTASIPVAWRIGQGADTVVSCLSKTDFSSRYEGASFDNDAVSTGSIIFLPTGVATNTADLVFGFVAGSVTKRVVVNAGGTASVE